MTDWDAWGRFLIALSKGGFKLSLRVLLLFELCLIMRPLPLVGWPRCTEMRV
jgi:hypothetical protein